MLALVFLATPVSVFAGEKKLEVDVAEMKVRLRLNAIESSLLTEHYGYLFKREIELRDSVRAGLKSGDERLPDYQRALADTQSDLAQTKKKLITLEAETAKFIERLGPKHVAAEPTEHTARLSRILEQLLDRLIAVEKRLQKLER
jgi:hypothetical protein